MTVDILHREALDQPRLDSKVDPVDSSYGMIFDAAGFDDPKHPWGYPLLSSAGDAILGSVGKREHI